MSKRNVLLFLSGGSWRALAGGAGQGRAISLARALGGLPSLDSQATAARTEAASASPQGHQLPLACPSPLTLGSLGSVGLESRWHWDALSTVGTDPGDLCHLQDMSDSPDGTTLVSHHCCHR